MKQKVANNSTPKKENVWQKTPYKNLIRYTPSGMYFLRVRVNGTLHRRKLETDVLSVAKLRLVDNEKELRSVSAQQIALNRGRGKMSFGQATEIYRQRLANHPNLKSKTKDYYEQRLTALFKSWPALKDSNLSDITKKACLDWAGRFKGSATAFNNTVIVFRAILEIGIENGVLYENVARHIERKRVKAKELHLPDNAQFGELVKTIEKAGGRFSRSCADLVRFLAYGGFRLGEAKHIMWRDCDFQKEEIFVRGDPDETTKNNETRRVPMIPEMRSLLTKLRKSRSNEGADARVMSVSECQQAMERATAKLQLSRLTHHDLRHLFATRCIESGVDIPTVSRWLGHKDGGALAMKVYGHLRNQHSSSMAKLVNFSSK